MGAKSLKSLESPESLEPPAGEHSGTNDDE